MYTQTNLLHELILSLSLSLGVAMSAQPGPPHEALYLCLAYFAVQELLAASESCSSLRDAVRNDDGVLPWLNVVVEKPLSRRLTDDSLARVASMARGKLRTLALYDCANITDLGIQRVVQTNPLIDKLLIPGCTGLTPEGVIRAVKTLSSSSKKGHTIKSLHINGIYNIQKHHIQALHSYLQPKQMDVEICPRCDEPRAIFSCPRKSCSKKLERPNPREHCRACMACIRRCKECAVCVDEREELEEVLCADALCSDCWLRLPKCRFCNKPYCKQHAEDKRVYDDVSTSGSEGFVCDVCQAKSIEFAYDEDE